jgi:cell division protein ZapA
VPRVDIALNGRTYPVACGEGEEERVRAIAAYVDEKAAQIRASAGHVSDAHLLALTCLMLGDELFEAGTIQPGRGGGPRHEGENEAELAEAIGALADHVEALVGQVRRG